MSPFPSRLLAIVLASSPAAASAADLLVQVDGVASAAGRVGCALYDDADGFPGGGKPMAEVAVPADPAGVTCRFARVPGGFYAVAVTHDVDGNGRLDTNLVGIPSEPWGVSNDARPSFRAPTFAEAQVAVPGKGRTTLRVRVE